MPETLTELVAKIRADTTELKKGLTDAEKQTKASSKKMAESLKKVGAAMAASGAAITAALGLMGKAAIDEEINIKRLATTINNSGTAYDSVKDSLEAVIATTQRKTGIADNEQRDILNRLILVTNDYNKALELLPTVLDLAAAGEMNATTAATYLGKAFLELKEGADSVSVRFGQASLQFKNMEDIQNRVAGAAEKLANPLSVLNASMGDVAETIGMNLLPMIKGAVDTIVDITIKIQEWIKENPELAKALTVVALGVGVVATIIGGLILILPTAIAGIAAFGVVLHAALGPVGLISLAVAGLIAGVIALGSQLGWFKTKTEAVIAPLKTLEEELANTRKEATQFAAEAEVASGKAIKAFDHLGEQIISALKERNREMEQADRDSLDQRLQDLRDSTRDTIREYEDEAQEILRVLESRRDIEIKSNEELITSENRRHETVLTNLEIEARKTKAALSEKAQGQIKELEASIDAIRKSQQAADDTAQEARDRNRLKAIADERFLAKATGDKVKAARLDEELVRLAADILDRKGKRERQAQIESLNIQIDFIRDGAQKDKDAVDAKLQTDKDAEKAAHERQIKVYETAITERRAFYAGEITDAKQASKDKIQVLEDEKTEEEKLLETERKALDNHYKLLNKEETLQGEARKLILDTNQQELITLLTSYNPKWQDAGVSFGQSLINGLNSTKVEIQAAISDIMGLLGSAWSAQALSVSAAGGLALDIAAAQALSEGIKTGGTTPVQIGGGGEEVTISAEEMQRGGLITRPTLALVGEKGPEAIIPLDTSMGGLSIIFEGPVYGLSDFEQKVAEAVKNHAVRGGFHGVLKEG